jgi:hypothetical protein
MEVIDKLCSSVQKSSCYFEHSFPFECTKPAVQFNSRHPPVTRKFIRVPKVRAISGGGGNKSGTMIALVQSVLVSPQTHKCLRMCFKCVQTCQVYSFSVYKFTVFTLKRFSLSQYWPMF